MKKDQDKVEKTINKIKLLLKIKLVELVSVYSQKVNVGWSEF